MLAFAVLTPGRTGSQLIANNLTRVFNIPRCYSIADGPFLRGVYHTHNPTFDPINTECIAIVSRRYDRFAEIVSSLITIRTNQVADYTKKVIEPFIASEEEFKNAYVYHTAYYEIINKDYFKKTVDIYYEDFIQDNTYLFNQLGLAGELTEYNLTKSPYAYSELIINWKDLKSLYDNLVQTPLTVTQIEAVKDNLKTDIKQR